MDADEIYTRLMAQVKVLDERARTLNEGDDIAAKNYAIGYLEGFIEAFAHAMRGTKYDISELLIAEQLKDL